MTSRAFEWAAWRDADFFRLLSTDLVWIVVYA